MEGRLVLCREVSSTDDVQIDCGRDSDNEYDFHFCTDPPFCPEVAIV